MMSILKGILFYIGIGGAIFFGFGVMGLVSDLILPHWKWLNNWIYTLPMMQEDKDSY